MATMGAGLGGAETAADTWDGRILACEKTFPKRSLPGPPGKSDDGKDALRQRQIENSSAVISASARGATLRLACVAHRSPLQSHGLLRDVSHGGTIGWRDTAGVRVRWRRGRADPARSGGEAAE